MPPVRRQKYKHIPKVPNNSASFYQILAKQVSTRRESTFDALDFCSLATRGTQEVRITDFTAHFPAAEKYGMTKSNICVIVKTNNLTKVKVGVQNLIVKKELDRIMASRLAQFGAYRLQ